MTEQVIMTMAVAGIITKAGQSVRVAFEASEIAKITAAMVSGVRKFTTGAFLSVSKYVGPLGTNAIRAVRASIDEVARWTRTNGITNGEIIASLMERLGPAKLTYQEIGYYLSKVCKTHDDWVKIGTPALPLLAGLAESLGLHLTEKGVHGFLNLWKGALRNGNAGHYMAQLYSLHTVGGVLDVQGMAKFLEMFDDLAAAGYRFTPDATDLAKWISPAGVVYTSGSAEGHRLMHLLSHFKADPIRTAANKPHGIFTPMARNNVYQLVDDIVVNWNTLAKVPAGNGMWNIQMGDFIGNADNISGLPVRNVAQGYQPTKWVQFICKGGNPINVTTLYPVIP